MQTISLGRSETRSISIAARAATVFDLLADARRLPEWAPAFAQAVEAAGDDWLIHAGAGRFRIRMVASRRHGTVDLLPPDDPSVGAHLRVVANGNGSEFVFTLIFPPRTPDAMIAEQMAVVEAELRTVRDHCESQAAKAPN